MFVETSPAWGLIQSAISALAGLGGVCVGALMTAHNQKIERRNAQLEDQLKSFYSPLMGMKSEVRAKVALRKKVHDVAAAEWQKLFKGVDDPSQRKAVEDAKWPAY